MRQPLFVFLCLFIILCCASPLLAQTETIPQNSLSAGLRSDSIETPYQRGLTAFKAGNIETALQEMKSAVTANEKDADAQRWLGFLLVKENKPAEAIPHLERALVLLKAKSGAKKPTNASARTQPGLADTYMNLGNALLLKPGRTIKESERGITLFKTAATLMPSEVAYYNLGYAFAQNSRYEQAIQAYKMAIHLGPKEERVWRSWSGLGYALQRTGKLNEAAAAYRQATTLNPQDASLWASLGGLEMERGNAQHVSAVNALEMAHKIEPQNYNAQVQLARAYAEAGRFADSAALFQSASALPEAGDSVAMLHFNAGVVLAKAGKLDDAEVAYQKALALHPHYFDALVNSGFVLYKSGKLDEAVSRFKSATEVNPASTLAWTNLGATYTQKKDTENAVAVWQHLAKMNRKDYESRSLLASLLVEQGKISEAIPVYRQMAQIRPKSALPLNAMGLAYQKQSNTTGAFRAFQEAVHREPRNAAAHNNLGVLYEKRGMLANAVHEYRVAVSLDKSFADAKANLARFGTPANTPKAAQIIAAVRKATAQAAKAVAQTTASTKPKTVAKTPTKAKTVVVHSKVTGTKEKVVSQPTAQEVIKKPTSKKITTSEKAVSKAKPLVPRPKKSAMTVGSKTSKTIPPKKTLTAPKSAE